LDTKRMGGKGGEGRETRPTEKKPEKRTEGNGRHWNDLCRAKNTFDCWNTGGGNKGVTGGKVRLEVELNGANGQGRENASRGSCIYQVGNQRKKNGGRV